MRDREASLLGTYENLQLETFGKNIAVNQKHKIDILYVLTTKLLAYHFIFVSVVFGFVSEKKTTLCDILRDFFSKIQYITGLFYLNPNKNP